jgi:MFS family permease
MKSNALQALLAHTPEARAKAFVVLFTCDAVARTLLISIVPLQIYVLLGGAQLVSVVYFAAAFVGLATNLVVPILLHHIRRRWILTAGAILQVITVALLAYGTPTTVIVGLALQSLAMAMLDIVLNLYMLDHIPRRELNVFEPRRLLFTGSAFSIGPWLGVFLNTHVAYGLAYLIAGLSAISLVTFFWRLQLVDNSAIRPPNAVSPSPLHSIPRFASQPRLVLSWVLSLGRSGWWVMNFIYVPIYVSNAGYGPEAGGALISLGLAAMLLVRVWGRLGERIGVRNVMAIGYTLTGLLSLLASALAFANLTTACMITLWCAAVSATLIDGAGNVTFLRAVRHFERAAMTSVFMTFRHAGALLVPGILAIVLWFMPLPAVFAFGGCMTLAMAILTRQLPKSF